MLADPGYRMALDEARRLLTIRLHGHWTMAIQLAFEAEMDRNKADLRRRYGSLSLLRVLVDAREHGVQSALISDRIRAYSEAFTRDVGRTAVLTQGPLHRLQAKRMASGATYRTFVFEEEALAWLLD